MISIHGTIVTNEMLAQKSEVLETNDNDEIIAIKVKNAENSLASDIKIGDFVNVYASAKISELKNVANVEEFESYSNDSVNGYITIKILDKVEVLKCFNSDGNSDVKDKMIEGIVVSVNKSMAIKINNLKNYCQFSLSKVY